MGAELGATVVGLFVLGLATGDAVGTLVGFCEMGANVVGDAVGSLVGDVVGRAVGFVEVGGTDIGDRPIPSAPETVGAKVASGSNGSSKSRGTVGLMVVGEMDGESVVGESDGGPVRGVVDG